MEREEESTIKSDETLFAVVEGIREIDGGRITDIADHTGISKSTVYRHAKTLEKHEFVVERDGEYHLGMRFLDFGGYVRRQNEAAKQIRPRIERLADETGELTAFVVEEYGLGVFVYRGIGSNAVGTDARIGKRFHLHALAAGKAILAELPRERVDGIVDEHGLPELTAGTITDRERLHDELDAVRDRGYAFDRQEHIKGLNAVATTVHGPDDELLGAVNVAGPSHRMKGDWFEEEIPELLLGVVNEFELDITYA
ncbi:IclR family transcriptional regulator [Halobacteriales archaeon QS_1_68_17]|nr:MAG: IclR family transcriptional regulator [Halobacteriales archaeon QS_1_68_17]